MTEGAVTSISWPLRPFARRVKWTGVGDGSPTSSGCPPCALRQVSDLVLIDPIPEAAFEEDQWKEYW